MLIATFGLNLSIFECVCGSECMWSVCLSWAPGIDVSVVSVIFLLFQ